MSGEVTFLPAARTVRASQPTAPVLPVPGPNTPRTGAQAGFGKEVPQSQPENASKSSLSDLVTQLNTQIQMVRRELKFAIDGQSGRTVISVIDTDTHEVIRQIPSEEVLTMAETLGVHHGGLVKEKA